MGKLTSYPNFYLMLFLNQPLKNTTIVLRKDAS